MEKKKIVKVLAIVGALLAVLLLVAYVVAGLQGSFFGAGTLVSDAPSVGFAQSAGIDRTLDMASSKQSYNGAPSFIAPVPPNQGSEGSIKERVQTRVIRNASLSIYVENVSKSIAELEKLAAGLGGFVQSSSIWEVRTSVRNGSASMRIPESKFTEAVEGAKSLAIQIESEQTNSQDVTAEYVDLKARLGAAEAEEMQYLQILQRAYQISDVLQVTQQLGNVRSRIESLKGQIQLMENQTDYSTVTVSLKEEVPLSPIVAKWRPLQHVVDAWRTLVATLKGLVSVLIWLVVYIVPLAILVYAVWRAIKAVRRRMMREVSAQAK
jgi:hypothetical protein